MSDKKLLMSENYYNVSDTKLPTRNHLTKTRPTQAPGWVGAGCTQHMYEEKSSVVCSQRLQAALVPSHACIPCRYDDER